MRLYKRNPLKKGRGRRAPRRMIRNRGTRVGKIWSYPKVGGIHFFKAKKQLTGIDPSNTAGEIARQYIFDITQIGNVTEYTALFDQYKIMAVKLEFRLKKQPGSLGTASQLPALATVLDYDGTANVDNTYSNLVTREGVRVTYFSDAVPYIKYYIKPKCVVPTMNIDPTVNPPTFAVTGRTVRRPGWQDFGSIAGGIAAQHFGLLANAPGVGLTVSAASIDVYQTIYFACRNHV